MVIQQRHIKITAEVCYGYSEGVLWLKQKHIMVAGYGYS